MFGSRRRRDISRAYLAARSLNGTPPLGIGALVIVNSIPGTADEWEGEPIGVIVALGADRIVGYPGMPSGTLAGWTVAFDGLAWMADGRGPFEHATIPAQLLTPVPVAPVWTEDSAFEL
jgi:hypothetical protein